MLYNLVNYDVTRKVIQLVLHSNTWTHVLHSFHSGKCYKCQTGPWTGLEFRTQSHVIHASLRGCVKLISHPRRVTVTDSDRMQQGCRAHSEQSKSRWKIEKSCKLFTNYCTRLQWKDDIKFRTQHMENLSSMRTFFWKTKIKLFRTFCTCLFSGLAELHCSLRSQLRARHALWLIVHLFMLYASGHG